MTLAETQNTIQRLLVLAVAATVVFYVGKYSIRIATNIYRNFFPEKKAEPAATFGKLPKLKMTTYEIRGTPSYSLVLTESELAGFPDRMYVYKFKEPKPSVAIEDKVKQIASGWKFADSYEKLSNSDFKWTDANNQRTFDANVTTGFFKLNTDGQRSTTLANNGTNVVVDDAKNRVITYLNSQNLIAPSDQSNTYAEAIASEINLGRLKENTANPDRGKIIRVNIYRNVLESERIYPIFSNNIKDSLINFMVTSQSEPFRFTNANYTYWEVDYEQKSDYYISSPSNVWEAISNGNGVISYLKLENEDYYSLYRPLELQSVEIREISLAYFESKDYTPYLQPIYVFKGVFDTKPLEGQLSQNGEIYYIYPAIRGDFVE